jgi:TatA/E family protein of Tat protein translocase
VFGIGSNELFLILLFGFLLFGPDKLPGVGRTVGRAIRQFREAMPIGPARMPIMDHLGELRRRLTIIVVSVIITAVVMYEATRPRSTS